MNKTQQLANQAATIQTQRRENEALRAQLKSENDLVVSLLKQAAQDDKRTDDRIDAQEARHAAEKKAATEAATLKSIREGFVPIAVLRDLTGAEYTTERCQSFTKTNLTVMLNAAKPVDKAILAALLEKPKDALGYATGGFTGVRFDDAVAPTTKTHLHYNPSIFTPGVVA